MFRKFDHTQHAWSFSGFSVFNCLLLQIFFLAGCILPATCRAQEVNIRFEKYTTQNGLTQNSTGPLLQDNHGFLWIGSSWGLNRYDGRIIKQYNKIGENNLADLLITSLAQDKEGNIWIGTANGLSCFDPATEKFTYYSEGRTSHNILDVFCIVYVDKEDNVWIAGNHSISLYNRSTKIFERFPISTVGIDVRINPYIDDMLEDSKGRFWISTSYGLKLFDRKTKTYRSYHFEEVNEKNVSENAVQGLFEDKGGTIWAGTWNGGILKYD